MSKLTIFLIVIGLVFVASKTLKKKVNCIMISGDCDLSSYCCEDFVCKDYRCALKGTKDNQIPWHIRGGKCDWFHHCNKGLECQSHRCLDVDMIAEMNNYEKGRTSKEETENEADKE